MYELNHSVCSRYSKAVNTLFKELCSDIKKHRRVNKISKGDLQSIKEAIQCFLRNCKNNKGVILTVPLDRNVYNNRCIINGRVTPYRVSYTFTKDLIEYLYNFGYIDMKIGYSNYSFNFKTETYHLEDKRPTTVILKQPLIELLESIKVSSAVKTNVVLLKGKDDLYKSFKLTESTCNIRDFLKTWNAYSLDKEVVCEDKVYDVQSYKIFNVKQDFGGRTYMGGSIQNLSSEERSKITIDGNKTCRYDYKAFEPSLAYSLKGIVLKGDPYEIKGFEDYDYKILRDVCKKSLLIMLNADSKASTAYAMNSYIKSKYDVKDLCDKGLIPKPKIPVAKIIDCLEEKHEDIYDMFYAESWKVLQKKGSEVIDSVLEYMMQNHDCLCLQVFDECIVEERFEKQLVEAMIEAYGEVVGIPENCKIEKEN